jgi:cholinesterase
LPYLNGNNDNEASYYKIPAYAQNVTLNASSWDEFNLEDFTCPTSTESNNCAVYGVPTWRFRYFGDWDNLRLYTNPCSGAYHGSDLEMVLGVSQDVSGLPESDPEDAATSEHDASLGCICGRPGQRTERKDGMA